MNPTYPDPTLKGVTHRFVAQVYRYHLARRGNQREAEHLTRATFKSTVPATGYTPGGESSEGAFRVAIFRAALRQQFATRHDRSGANLAEGDPNETQEVLFQRARLAALAEYWASLPSWQADVLALASFGELDGRAISQVTRRGLAEIETLLTGQARMLQELAGLAGQVQPPVEFVETLQDELDQLPRRVNRTPLSPIVNLFTRLDWAGWLHSLAARRVSQLAIGGAVVLLLAYGMWATFLTQATAPTTSANLSTLAKTTGTAVSAHAVNANTGLDIVQPRPGLLVPPDQAICLHWQTVLTELIEASAPLAMIDNTPIDDPATSGMDGAGYGCFVDINPDGQLYRTNMSRIQSYLTAQGFQRIAAENADCPTPPATSSRYTFSNGCGGSRSASWINPKSDPQQRVIVELLSRWPTSPSSLYGSNNPSNSPYPRAPVSAGEQKAGSVLGTPIAPPAGTPIAKDPCLRVPSDGACQQPRESRPRPGFIFRIGIASAALRPLIDSFLNQWAAGQSGAAAYLTPELRANLPDLAAMDHLASITRRPDLGVKITWQMLDNSGHLVRLQLTVDQTSALALPSRHTGPFQVVFSLVNQKWQVSALSLGPA